jgi:mono/diheme cytochrome c family protein
MSKIAALIILLALITFGVTACQPDEAEPTPGDGGIPDTAFPDEPPPTPIIPPPTPNIEPVQPTPIPDPPDPQTEEELIAWGQEIYIEACAACHRPGGEGVVGAYPPLDGNPFVAAVDPHPVTQVIITGRGGMPGFYEMLETDELAAVISYIRTAWSNQASAVSVEDVEAAWDATDFPREVSDEDEDEEEEEEGED